MMVLVYVKTLNTDKNELKGSCNACDIGGLAVSDGHDDEQTDSEKNATQERDMQFLQQKQFKNFMVQEVQRIN